LGAVDPDPAAEGRFGDVLATRVAARRSQIVLGLDPDPNALWPQALQDASALSGASPSLRAAAAVAAHCKALIDAAGPACVAVKPQLACFERLAAEGRAALADVLAHARAAGLLTIADGKRGDIDVSAAAYAQSLFEGFHTPFGVVSGLQVDAATVNPLMGRDTLAPFLAAARTRTAGLFALVRTSNPGAADIQELTLADGSLVWERLAAIVAELGSEGVGESGLSDLGAVVGATAPDVLARAREAMPHAVLLLPGVGAQGGRVEDLAPAFAPGPAGGLVSASRSIAGAYLKTGEEPSVAAHAEAQRLREIAWALAA
jgi:orotidine-5'-phosphate decarboxylase